jgi:hypothetical protein
MKKFNLFKEIIVVSKAELLQAINTAKEFGITTKGTIKYAPFEENEILIYAGTHTKKPLNPLMPSAAPSVTTMLGKNYQVVEDDERVLIKAFSNWQELIKLNLPRASYDDTTGDGVSEFAHKELEDIGWHATEFNISYRALVEELEAKCEGTLLCIEQEEPYQFSGLGFIKDVVEAKEVLFSYAKEKVQTLMNEDEDYALENLTDDELDAAKFFELA